MTGRGRDAAPATERAAVGAVPDLRGAVGIFGGTFDPIHHAHLAVAEGARDTLGLASVVFIPAGRPPHKPDRTIAPAEDRLAMVELAIAGNPGFSVSRIELERDGPSYTVDTLRALAAGEGIDRDHPSSADGTDVSTPLALILSAEAFLGLPTWHDPGGVLGLATLVVAPRDGYADADAAFLERHFPRVDVRAVFLDGPRMRLSASELRSRAASGRSLRYLVPDAVATYIGDHGLYQDPQRMHRT